MDNEEMKKAMPITASTDPATLALAKDVAQWLHETGRRMSQHTLAELFDQVRPFYVALRPNPNKPQHAAQPPRQAGPVLAAPVAEMPRAVNLDEAFDKLGI